jgi:hypothetical protein
METATTIIVKIIVGACSLYVSYLGIRVAKIKIQESIRSRPHIAEIHGFDNTFWLIITNSKPRPITIQKVAAKKKLIGSFFFKSTPLEWHPATNYQPDYGDPIADTFKKLSAQPQYAFERQQTINGKFLKHVPGTIYKIVVTTSGGQCQSIYRSPLKRPNG